MNCITYARISPRPTESESLDQQEKELALYAAKQGWTVRAHFADDRLSGSELLRPGIQDALKTLRKGEVLLVRDLSRFARCITVALALEAELRRIGAHLATYESGIVLDPTADDLAYHDAILPRFVKYWSDARERLTKNARTSQRMREHQASGRPMGGHAPYGWRIEDGRLVEDEEEQGAIATAKKLRLIGRSYLWIAGYLNEGGFSSRGERWHAETVRRMLAAAES